MIGRPNQPFLDCVAFAFDFVRRLSELAFLWSLKIVRRQVKLDVGTEFVHEVTVSSQDCADWGGNLAETTARVLLQEVTDQVRVTKKRSDWITQHEVNAPVCIVGHVSAVRLEVLHPGLERRQG